MLILYSLIVSAFFGGLLYYLIDVALLPYTNDNVVDVKNLIIVGIVFICAFSSFFSFFHMLVDKLFFRKFYQKPRLVLALRRGIILALIVVGFAWMRIFDFWQVHIILLAVSLGLLFEALFLSIQLNLGALEKSSENKEPLSS